MTKSKLNPNPNLWNYSDPKSDPICEQNWIWIHPKSVWVGADSISGWINQNLLPTTHSDTKENGFGQFRKICYNFGMMPGMNQISLISNNRIPLIVKTSFSLFWENNKVSIQYILVNITNWKVEGWFCMENMMTFCTLQKIWPTFQNYFNASVGLFSSFWKSRSI